MSPEDETSDAQAAMHWAQVEKLGLESRLLELDLEVKGRDSEKINATSSENRVFHFFDAVTGQSAYVAMTTTAQWARRQPGVPITVMFNSPGGNIIDGLALFDHFRELEANGTPVITVCVGMAASMGGILLQAGSTRIMGRNAFLMIHEASYGTGGKVSDMEDDVAFVKRLQDKLVSILAERSTLSPAAIRRKWKRTDWWLSAEEALELGFVDKIREEWSVGNPGN